MEPTLERHDRVITTSIDRTQGTQRGDIVVFISPPAMSEATGGGEYVVLFRVVGLPGETFEVRDGQTLINQVPLPEPYVQDPPEYSFGPITIPPDAYIVLGDNRNNAFDSTAWGFLPAANITGKVQSVYWPPGRFGSVYD